MVTPVETRSSPVVEPVETRSSPVVEPVETRSSPVVEPVETRDLDKLDHRTARSPHGSITAGGRADRALPD
ncbi:hypothetical protein E3T48_01350 [Cryobacterium fucosi]|uniref:Uncharacterized protein n=1 Tax=Cryobacterium fucosi TaxID=1259157 RepID=A0A4R9BF19_9MICO|nr:hypothetical protein E3T48_01350 [Cryobacterium fucosi]